MNNPLLLRLFPFLAWFPISSTLLRGDMIAGITGALVLVPKAMAYAQLSGLPVYYGLYVAFVPAILGALWGSSRQLSTGPVAIVSLMTAAAITPLAVPFSEEYIGLALLLSLMVGVIQFSLGVIKLGSIVNFVSHPVILGFMNAAAVIIALSQLDMLLGIPKGRSDSFLYDIWEMFGYLPDTHLPTLAMSVFALLLMLGLKRVPALSKLSVLIAVVVTIAVSALTGFERKVSASPAHIADPEARALVSAYAEADRRIQEMSARVTALSSQARLAHKTRDARGAADLEYAISVLKLDIAGLETENKARMHAIRRLDFTRVDTDARGAATLYLAGKAPVGPESDTRQWHIKKIEQGEIKLVSGGDVVGKVPSGLPGLRLPPLSLDAMLQLLSAAFIIALVAFMESISMAKALAAKTKQRLDPNQELIGQGLANIGGAFFQAYPACGSFTGSAINLQAGARTGFAMVFNGLFVAVTLLFLTDYLYHLPKATLAVIILLAVSSLITPKALKHTWQASRFDGIVAGVTFVITLIAAPHLDKGILIGAGLAIVLYLYRTMKPRVAQLGRFADGTLRDIKVHPTLPTSPYIIAMRFDGSLYFANIAYFEDTVLELIAAKPDARYLLVVGDAINQLDASGEEVVHHLVERLRGNGMEVVFSGLKKQILDVMRATGLFDLIGQDNIFATEDQAIAAIQARLGEQAREDAFCLLPTRA
ncbi:MAG TPA: SulP family inorganic anion transporter [Thiobacillaceae bacterium]|nr:SulP family inorganic anion transporter [Thiobacillaceae bacterium]HNU65101.1 SulP family inorganic anion transporter [Thiobacillaceae bacterium]